MGVVGGTKVTQPTTEDVVHIWKIKAGKSMFSLKTTIEKKC